MRFPELERSVIETFGNEKFPDAVGHLVGSLMASVEGSKWGFWSDGLSFLRETIDDCRFVGRGRDLLLTGDGHFLASPIQAAFNFSYDKTDINAAEIKYGSCELGFIECELYERKKQVKRFLSDESFQFDWMRIFRFDGAKWSVSSPQFKREEE